VVFPAHRVTVFDRAEQREGGTRVVSRRVQLRSCIGPHSRSEPNDRHKLAADRLLDPVGRVGVGAHKLADL
jgi:hypothetical protein